MTIKLLFSFLLLISLQCSTPPPEQSISSAPDLLPEEPILQTGAERIGEYLPLLQNKKIGLVVNQTSMVGEQHLVDLLLEKGIDVTMIFAPEHGFRGEADAGAKITDGKDPRTGVPIVSLYGKKKKPAKADLAKLDGVIFDIQDVGARFYTYISTMHYVMQACAETGVPFMVLDRPNPNGHYVDGPIMEPSHQSFVGMHPIPVVHGMTIGEYASMVNGEGWLGDGLRCELTVIPCAHYDHQTFYELPIKPSPNLPNIRSIYLYPSICFFEGTSISVGRGTPTQFQVLGHPDYPDGDYTFTPISRSGAKYPKHQDKECRGYDLSRIPLEDLRAEGQLNLGYLLEVYQNYPDKASFFNKNLFFDKLAGSSQLREQLIEGYSETQIRASWEPGLSAFKEIREKYLLY